jgi:hypothetical protein
LKGFSMPDFDQAQRQNLSVVDDAPPTQPQSLPEAPTLQDVQQAAELLLLLAGDQAVHELYSHFEAKSADDLAETDWSEFIRLAKMSCEDRARILGSKQTAPSGTASPEPHAPDYTFEQAKPAWLSIVGRFGIHIAKEALRFLGRDTLSPNAPNWMFAELVRFSRLEASSADEFCAALTAESVEFLEKLRPGGPWVLTAIVPDGTPTTITAKTPKQAQRFIRDHNGQRNVYFSVNPTRTPMDEKAAKADIAAIEYAFADLDPAEGESPADAKARYRTQLETFEPRPTFVIDSGNGIQLLWRLAVRIVLGEPVPGPQGKSSYSPKEQAKIDDAEARNAAVMVKLNAKAGTQNIDRTLRLPGTTNLPNAKKRRGGGRFAKPSSSNSTMWPIPLRRSRPWWSKGGRIATRRSRRPGTGEARASTTSRVCRKPISPRCRSQTR